MMTMKMKNSFGLISIPGMWVPATVILIIPERRFRGLD
jgi:hypothetical protein